MWFANGMSEYDVMTLTGHSSFATTHEFYLAVADDLIGRARVATAQGLRQKLVRFGTRSSVHTIYHTTLSAISSSLSNQAPAFSQPAQLSGIPLENA